MLYYMGSGQRNYGQFPMQPFARHYWEFEAVVKGRLAMLLPKGPEPLRDRHLWLTAPGHKHGWIGDPENECEVIVFHFISVPEALQRCVPAKGQLSVDLDEKQLRRLKELSSLIALNWQNPSPEILLRHEHLLLELSLLVYDSSLGAITPSIERSRLRVQKALQWYGENLNANPSFEEVAHVCNSSVSQLRRSFRETMHASPKNVFDQMRFQRAIEMMTDSSIKLSIVSEACGFDSMSSFSRAFKNKFGCSPGIWRGHLANND